MIDPNATPAQAAALRLRLAIQVYGPKEWGYWEDHLDILEVIEGLEAAEARAERAGKALADFAQDRMERDDQYETTIARLLRLGDHTQARFALQAFIERVHGQVDKTTIANLVMDLFAEIDEAGHSGEHSS